MKQSCTWNCVAFNFLLNVIFFSILSQISIVLRLFGQFYFIFVFCCFYFSNVILNYQRKCVPSYFEILVLLNFIQIYYSYANFQDVINWYSLLDMLQTSQKLSTWGNKCSNFIKSLPIIEYKILNKIQYETQI